MSYVYSLLSDSDEFPAQQQHTIIRRSTGTHAQIYNIGVAEKERERERVSARRDSATCGCRLNESIITCAAPSRDDGGGKEREREKWGGERAQAVRVGQAVVARERRTVEYSERMTAAVVVSALQRKNVAPFFFLFFFFWGKGEEYF